MRVPGALTEPLSEALMEAGACSVDVADAFAGTEAEVPKFGEPGAESPGVWPDNSVTALFDESDDAKLLFESACHAIGIEAIAPQIDRVADEDWVRLTQSQFDPIRVSDRLWIVPTWHDVINPGALNLRLDPGLAFGTGSHPTTHLCLQWLDRHLCPGQSVIDYGCGSGILAIAAKMLGAGEVTGIDIDAQAVVAARANANRNGVEARFYDANVMQPAASDIVVANILANPLRALAPLICALVKPKGAVVLSGILEAQQSEVRDAYASWIDFEAPLRLDGWVAMSGIKR